MQRQRRRGWRRATGRLAGWLAAVSAVPVGQAGDGLTWATGAGRRTGRRSSPAWKGWCQFVAERHNMNSISATNICQPFLHAVDG